MESRLALYSIHRVRGVQQDFDTGYCTALALRLIHTACRRSLFRRSVDRTYDPRIWHGRAWLYRTGDTSQAPVLLSTRLHVEEQQVLVVLDSIVDIVSPCDCRMNATATKPEKGDLGADLPR